MDYADDYLSKMLPGFEKHPPTMAEVEEDDLEPIDPPAEEDQEPEPPEMLNEVVSYFRRYLVCDDHQLTLLSLWSLHTWCYSCFLTTPYLDVRSPVPQSGKSLCLRLLREITDSPSFVRGAEARTLMRRLLTFDRSLKKTDENSGSLPDSLPRTILLDDCHHTFSASERQPLLSLFNSGSEATSCYPSGRVDYYLFGPKAFAGNAPLPHSLAGRCIPIALQRKKPSDVIARFNPDAVRDAGVKLGCQMLDWALDNSDALTEAAQQAPPQLPSNLTPGEQGCAEPLLHIADLIGGPWPQRARAALPRSSTSLRAASPSSCWATFGRFFKARTIPITYPRANSWRSSSNLTIARGAPGPANPERSSECFSATSASSAVLFTMARRPVSEAICSRVFRMHGSAICRI